jgi:hypothetical protein
MLDKDISIEKRRKTRIENELRKRNSLMEEAKKEITILTRSDLMLLGIALYWAEGSKSKKRIVSFSNSDPRIIKIMMRFFREICHVDERKFRGHIHVYSEFAKENAEKFWSEVTQIPLSQFQKTYVKQSIGSLGIRKTLPNGTIDIDVYDTKLFLRIIGWIHKISELLCNS